MIEIFESRYLYYNIFSTFPQLVIKNKIANYIKVKYFLIIHSIFLYY